MTAWLACLAILFAALGPSLTRAANAMGGEPWIEVCTAEGIRLVKLSDKDDPAPAPLKQLSHVEHCEFCATHGFAFAPAAGNGFALRLPTLRDSFPALFFQAPSPLPVWAPAQSRAPPALS